ncbi:VirB4 family type IV secretion system protein [Eubacterium multiforme]|uniref:TraG P-loop domain-containing protein n=1 Tax=Eubacterium multiforme TaxID=83339 RepID=A0ABT9UTI5_9FIRM|nr:ATP-binding protein [Eubacterium multiforme]MDQ0149627.1 hypothetical protein [Eubacterium multiforme]
MEKIKYKYNPHFINLVQPCGGISFKENYIKKGDGYEACIHVYDFPTTCEDFWLNALSNISNDVVTTVDIRTADMSKINSKLNKALAENRQRQDEKDNVEAIKATGKVQDLAELTNDIVKHNEVVKYIIVRYYVYAKTLKELDDKVKGILNQLETLTFKGAVFLNEQEEEWKSLFLSISLQNKLKNKIIEQPIQGYSLAGGYPFHFVELCDPTGRYLGYTKTGGNVIFDLFTKNNKRKSFNALLVGLTGAGKSTTLKKLLDDNAIIGNTIRVLDLSGEFRKLVLKRGGKVIKLDGTEGMINPFQVFATMVDTETNEVLEELSYMFQLSKLTMMYQFLSNNYDNAIISEFERLVNEFYRNNGITKDSCTSFKANEYPIMEDFLDFLERELYDDVKNKILKNNLSQSRIEKIETIITTITATIDGYGSLFNGHSTLEDVSSEQIISYEVRNLSQLKSNVFNAQIFNVLTMIWNEALKQGVIEKRKYDNGEVTLWEAKKFLAFVDEAHKYINSNNEYAVDYFINFVREARKYFAGLIYATHTLGDLVPKGNGDMVKNITEKIATLFELTQYKFIMQQDNNVKEAMEKTFKNQLTESEIEDIPLYDEGECMLIINGIGNIRFNIEISKEEEKLFAGGV